MIEMTNTLQPVTTVQSKLDFGGVPFGSSGPNIIPVSELPSFNGGIETTTISLNNAAAGIYYVEMKNSSNSYHATIMLQ